MKFIRILSDACLYKWMIYLLLIGSTLAQAQTGAVCSLSGGTNLNGRSFDSPSSALEAVKQEQNLPVQNPVIQACKGAWLRADLVLGDAIRYNGNLDYEVYVDADSVVCRDGQIVQTRHALYPLSVTITCAETASYQTLSASLETRPAATGGTSTVVLTAKTTTPNGQPKPGVALHFSVDVKPNSGGHDHRSNTRPKGTLSLVQGVTNANGELAVTFSAPAIAGIHTIKSTCQSCSNKEVSQDIQVKVPNLVEMLPDTAKLATYTLVGATGNHKSNHWFSSASVVTLGKVADTMFKTGWGVVGVNDGSLAWGGLFDINGGWTPSHHEHRVGTEVDLSVTNPRQVTKEQKEKTFDTLCAKDNTAFSIQTLWHQDDGYPEHFHMYLDGTGLTGHAAGGSCCTQYKTTRAKKDKNGNLVLGKDGKPVQETVKLCTETSPR